MSMVKNKSVLYAVMRQEEDNSVVCCFAKSLEKAENLCNTYQQELEDAWGDEVPDKYFYVVSNIYYDE
jgi:aminopeptidase C